MSDLKLKNKDVKNLSDKILVVGYCDLWYLLKCADRLGYTCGVYGWNSDIFYINGVVISTGYRPIGNIQTNNKKIKNKYINSLYNEKARKIWNDPKIKKYDTKIKKVRKLLDEYINTILGGVKND